jgi:ornithine decarboxylase
MPPRPARHSEQPSRAAGGRGFKPMNAKISRYLKDARPPTPCLIVDVDAVEESYIQLRDLLPEARVFYAVKANPLAPVVKRLNKLGSSFDTASRQEIDLCLKQGAKADRISFGNTIKKAADIAYAYEKGVRLFAFDSEAELRKIAAAAPGAKVFCRVLMECDGAEWPLSKKFGCAPKMAADLMVMARDLGLDAYGLSFHVGSQQTDLSQWDHALGRVSSLFSILRERDVELRMVNLGGGFPAQYTGQVAPLEAYARTVMAAVRRHFGNRIPELIVEPGRSLVGDAGVIQTEVVLISDKGDGDGRRWVYLDVGKFSGLAETMDESIKYRLRTPRDGSTTGPVVLAGPTCDSADILYEKTRYELPLDLAIGDKVEILTTGAYTCTYSSVGFNGFEPLKTICI